MHTCKSITMSVDCRPKTHLEYVHKIGTGLVATTGTAVLVCMTHIVIVIFSIVTWASAVRRATCEHTPRAPYLALTSYLARTRPMSCRSSQADEAADAALVEAQAALRSTALANYGRCLCAGGCASCCHTCWQHTWQYLNVKSAGTIVWIRVSGSPLLPSHGPPHLALCSLPFSPGSERMSGVTAPPHARGHPTQAV